VYCLRNDIAANVLWYNPTLMKRFGYSLPTTWQAYERLGLKVAKQHPGYLVGDAGGLATDGSIEMWSAKCTPYRVTGPNAVTTASLRSPNCIRDYKLLNALIAAGSVSTEGMTTPGFEKNEGKKMLLMPGPNWEGLALFKPDFGIKAKTLAAAPMPTWAGEKGPSDGDDGGGIYYLSSHLTPHQLRVAEGVIQWMATSPKWQDIGPTFPAYAPDDAGWVKDSAGGWFDQSIPSLTQVLDETAKSIWPGWHYVTFDDYASQFFAEAGKDHKPIQDLLSQWTDAEASSAEEFGYSVKTG
jgi:multiple sugar transport system substrate-binding protein